MFDQHATVSPAKPPESPDEEVDDPLYLIDIDHPTTFFEVAPGYVGCYHIRGV